MTDGSGGIDLDQVLGFEEAEKSLDRVQFTADGLGSIVFTI